MHGLLNMADFERLTPDESVLYKGKLKKKTGKKNWKDFCVVLKGNMMMFFDAKDEKWAGNIELHEGSTCTLFVKGTRIGRGIEDPTINTEIAELNKRKNREVNLKFTLHTKRGTHLLKADSETLCLEWIRELRKTVLMLREENYSKHSPGQTRQTALAVANKNRDSKNSFTYETIRAEDSESKAQVHPRKISRSKSLRDTRDSALDLLRRSRFHSFRKTSRNYNNLKES